MSFISGTVAAVKGADAQKDANAKNLRAAQQTNNANFILDLVRRGLPIPERVPGLRIPEGAAGVSSAILPFYMSDQEAALADYAGGAFGALSATPSEEELARFNAIAAGYRPSFEAGSRVVEGIFDDSITDQELAEARPVFDARLKLAGARRDSGLEALQEKLNEIRAIQGRKGFTGDSSAGNRLRFDATRKVYGDAAVDASSAELQNALEARAIRSGGTARKIAGLDIPIRRATQEFQLEDLPSATLRDRAQSNISVFNPFRLAGGFQPIQRPPTVEAVPGAAQLALQGVAALGSAVGNYFAGGNYFRDPNQQPQYGAPAFTSQANYGTYGSRTPAQQANFAAAQNYYGGNDPTGYNPSAPSGISDSTAGL